MPFDVLQSRPLFDLARAAGISLLCSYHFTFPGEDRNWLLTAESADQTANITINQEWEHETPRWMDTWIINDWAVYSGFILIRGMEQKSHSSQA